MIPPCCRPTTARPCPLSRAKGHWLMAEDGQRYLDLGAGIAVNALGHAHPALVAALTRAGGEALACVEPVPHPRTGDAGGRCWSSSTFADTVFFTNSGTEAAELAIKMARKYWYDKGQPERTEIVTFEGAFHGRSTGAIAAAGSEKMVKGFGPLMPGFVQLPFGDHDALRAAITDQTRRR